MVGEKKIAILQRGLQQNPTSERLLSAFLQACQSASSTV